MLTNNNLKHLIAACEDYLAGDDNHVNGFCDWFDRWLVDRGHTTRGTLAGYCIIDALGVTEEWLQGRLYVDGRKGRTRIREAFVWDLHRYATEHLEARRAATERDLQR